MGGKVGEGRHKRQAARKDRASAPRPAETMRVAKAMAHAGLCSRREAEQWIAQGRVAVNGKTLTTPAYVVGPRDRITVDGKPLPQAGAPRLWRYHKPRALVTSHKDPQGRKTVFAALPESLPRVVSVGRLDINTEGLLLLTTDGALARHLELPNTGWLRRYRVRAHGKVTQEALDALRDGVTIGGLRYGPVEARIDRAQGGNVWLTIGLREGKNREVRRLAEHLGLTVNRLIRVSFGPFALGDLAPGAVAEVKPRVLADQLGPNLAAEFGLHDTKERLGKGSKADTPPPVGRGRAEATRGEGAGEGEPKVEIRQRPTPSPFPPCDLRTSPQARGAKPSPHRGEGWSSP
jgi:23S rRNA pseudouridine2605 synthase